MDQEARIAAQVAHARTVGCWLQRLGWSVAVLGVAGVLTFAALWLAGQLGLDQAVSLILGTALAAILSGASAYGAGVNVGLGAERLALAARAAVSPPDGGRAGGAAG